MLQLTVFIDDNNYACIACFASLIIEKAQVLSQSCLVEPEAQRLASFCNFYGQAIARLLNKPAQKVRSQAATCFNEFNGGLLSTYERLVEAFIRNFTFDTDTYPLIHALENTTAILPEITCLACKMFFR